MTEQIARKLRGMITWGRKTSGNDTGNVQSLQVQTNSNEVGDNRPSLKEFGFTSMPPDGSDVAMVFLGGDRTNGLIIATGHQGTRLKNLADGETALYDATGKHVFLKIEEIEVNAGGMPVNVVNASTVTVTASGNVTVNAGGAATISAPSIILKNAGTALKKLCTSVFMTLYNSHTHNESGGGTTNAPNQQAATGTHTTNIVQAE